MEGRHQNSLDKFFYYLGVGFVILCIRTEIIWKPSIDVLIALWYTFGYVFTHDIWLALVIMFSYDIYNWVKKKVLKNDKS